MPADTFRVMGLTPKRWIVAFAVAAVVLGGFVAYGVTRNPTPPQPSRSTVGYVLTGPS
jgi:hypothetical protein